MYRIDIYLESSSWYLGERIRTAGYFMCSTLKSGKEIEDFKKMEVSGTYNHCLLQVLNQALGRIRTESEIHIYSANSFILDMIENNLPAWEKNSFRTSKGKDIKDQAAWMILSMNIRDHLIIPEPGLHEYSHWMKWMFLKDGDNSVDNMVEKPKRPHKQ